MPLDDLIAEGLKHFLGSVARVVIELFWEVLCRTLGYWTLRVLSFGHYEPDEEGWLPAAVGLLMLLGIVWAGLSFFD
jgi:hypothetical protein